MLGLPAKTMGMIHVLIQNREVTPFRMLCMLGSVPQLFLPSNVQRFALAGLENIAILFTQNFSRTASKIPYLPQIASSH